MSNSIANVTPLLLAQGLLAIRQNAIMPRVVNRDYQGLASEKGAVINVPIPSAITARAVTPAVTYAANQDSAPTVAVCTMDQWQEAPFQLHDKDLQEAFAGIMPMQASEAIKGLINAIDQSILSKHVGFYNASGIAGTTPFAATLTQAGTIRKLLNKSLAPPDSRIAVIDPDAEGNLVVNQEVLQSQMRGDNQGITNLTLGRKLGFDWYMDQNITTYTPGTAWATGFSISTLSVAVGDTTLNITNTTATGTINLGDIFTINGTTQQYVVTAAATFCATVPRSIKIYPALKAAFSANIAMTVIGTAYVANLAFHPNAIMFVSRPFNDVPTPSSEFMQETDPVSGLTLRLEISRQYKQTTFSFDALWGSVVLRPELGGKIMG